MSRAVSELTSITGRQRVPAQWFLGPLFDREVEEPIETAAKYEKQVEADIQNIVHYKLPVEAYRIEGWGLLSRSSLTAMIARLRELGIRPLLYFRPFVGQDPIGTELPGEYETAVREGYVATGGEGGPYIFKDNFAASAALIDFTNPAAVAWWKGRIDAALELGAEGFMLDFGEQVQPGMHFADGSTGAEMHNRYPVLFQRVTREIVEQFEAEHPGRQILFFTRSGYSGQPGSAAYTNFNFPGDETTDWTHSSGLAAQTPDMLNRAIGGAYGYGTDIGGYLDFYSQIDGRETFEIKPATNELFLRWAEWAALSPVFRLHGSIVFEHTPWSYSRSTAVMYGRSPSSTSAPRASSSSCGGKLMRAASLSPGRCICNTRRTRGRPNRNRSGCSARMCSSPPSSNRRPRHAACTSPKAAGGTPKPARKRWARSRRRSRPA